MIKIAKYSQEIDNSCDCGCGDLDETGNCPCVQYTTEAHCPINHLDEKYL